MPHVTVEQVSKFRDAALQALDKKDSEIAELKEELAKHHPTERELFENWLEFTKPEDDWSPLAVWCASAELKDKEIVKLRAELTEYREMQPVASGNEDYVELESTVREIRQ